MKEKYDWDNDYDDLDEPSWSTSLDDLNEFSINSVAETSEDLGVDMDEEWLTHISRSFASVCYTCGEEGDPEIFD